MDEWMNELMDGWMNEWMNAWIRQAFGPWRVKIFHMFMSMAISDRYVLFLFLDKVPPSGIVIGFHFTWPLPDPSLTPVVGLRKLLGHWK